jgi:hypothetical protein
MVRCLTLLDVDGKEHRGHVGGIAVSERHLWIGSGALLYRAELAEIVDSGPEGSLRLRDPMRTETTASYVAYESGRVWVGEFFL